MCDLLKNMEETQGERLKRLRLDKKLKQKELAKSGGLGQSAIAMIEADKRGYGAGIVAIAKALGTTPEYLQMEDQLKKSPAAPAINECSTPYMWPFKSIKPWQYELLEDADREAIENHILLYVKTRADSAKHPTPANYSAKVQAA